ncbi:MAG TPA: MATE family efflux transporter [Gemmatimonadaceae bacterium]|nr:MATE family efflux transporter [Gemmatimonadaceae bacterium]
MSGSPGAAARQAQAREMARLALPIVVVQVGLMAMGVVDTIMVGRVSAEALAATALAHLYFIGVGMFGLGVLYVLDPVVAQAVGAGDEEGVARGLQRGALLAAALSVITAAALAPAGAIFGLLRQPPGVVPLAAQITHVLIPGLLPFFLFAVARQTLQATGRVAPVVVAIVFGNAANALLNWMLIYGNLGSPALGALGSAWSTTIGRWLTLAVLLLAARRELAPFLRPRRQALAIAPLLRMARLGTPIGFQYVIEVSSFGVVTLMMGWLGAVELAGHEIALNLASLTFMVPMGLGAAASVVVGKAIGAGDMAAARAGAARALVWGVGFMALSAVAMVVLPERFAALYTTDKGVARLAASLIPIAGVFRSSTAARSSAGASCAAAATRGPRWSRTCWASGW